MSLRSVVPFFLPGSLFFLLAGLCLGVLLLFGSDRLRKLGRLWLLLIAAFYLFAGTDVGAGLMLQPLYSQSGQLTDKSSAGGANAVVLLNAGAAAYQARGQQYFGIGQDGALRALEAARVYRLVGDPLVIVAGGFPEQTDRPSLGAIWSKVLVDLGVPAGRIVIEPKSRDTREHAENLRPYLDKHGVKKFVLVTSPLHMRRSIAVFRVAGYDFVPSAAAVRSELEPGDPLLVPTIRNLARVQLGMHEYAGLAYYWWYDWL